MLLIWEPHFEKPWTRVILLKFSNQIIPNSKQRRANSVQVCVAWILMVQQQKQQGQKHPARSSRFFFFFVSCFNFKTQVHFMLYSTIYPNLFHIKITLPYLVSKNWWLRAILSNIWEPLATSDYINLNWIQLKIQFVSYTSHISRSQ